MAEYDYAEYDDLIGLLRDGGPEDWALAEAVVDGFPHGVDTFMGRRWILNAVDCGSPASVRWMIARGVELNFWDAEGRTVCEACLERKWPEKYDILRELIAAGADLNAHGMNDWTPLHWTVFRNDLEGAEILLAAGANAEARTRIDDYSTPLEDAERHGSKLMIKLLRKHLGIKDEH